MKYRISKTTLGVFLAVVATAVYAAESKIGAVMKDNFKGDSSTFKTVATGKGTDADAQKLLEAVKTLPTCKPPKGDEAAWKTKTEALVKAAEDVVAKKPGAGAALQKAGNCKECHTEFRPPKKQHRNISSTCRTAGHDGPPFLFLQPMLEERINLRIGFLGGRMVRAVRHGDAVVVSEQLVHGHRVVQRCPARGRVFSPT